MDFILRSVEHNEYLTYLIIGSLAILTSIKILYTYQFSDFLEVLANGKYFLLHNKGDKKGNLFNHLFYVFFALNATVFTYITLGKLGHLTSKDNKTIIIIILLINIYFISKYFIEKIIFEILDLNSTYENFNFQRLTSLNFISLFMLLLNIILLYINTNPSIFFIYACIGFLLFIYLMSVILITLYNQKLFLKHWFYIILYLCALEISPFLIGAIFLLTNILK